MRRKEVVETERTYCDGCGKRLGWETIYGYDDGIELGACCHDDLIEFEMHKMKTRYAISEIKQQPFFC